MIADQLLARIEFVHQRGVIHRDLKPANLMIGHRNDSNVIYLIDFGLSTRWQDQKTGEHIPYAEGKALVRTSRYTSVNTHCGIEQSRRDDLEAIAYILVYLVKGRLPWMGWKGESRDEKHAAIHQIKVETPPDVICSGLPKAFSDFLTAVRALGFNEVPQYSVYRALFRGLFFDGRMHL
jgi:serine/threonine protein kinase